MQEKAKFCLILVSMNNLVVDASSLSSSQTNVSEFKCESDGVCFQHGYNKIMAPQVDTRVYIYPPESVILRKVDVFASTITLDMFNTKIRWNDKRIWLNTSRPGGRASVGENYKSKIWIPPIVNRNRKSGTTTQIPTTPTSGKYLFKNDYAFAAFF